MRLAILPIIFLVSCSLADAEIIQSYWVRDFNTLQPIDAVNADLYNATFMESNVTDAYGHMSFWLNDSGNFSVQFTKTAYETKIIQRNISANDTEDILLNPQSTSGIIKLHVIDLAGGHATCIYYMVNGRLKECDSYNETGYIQIYTSTNYTFKPVMKSLDMFSTPSNFVKYYKIWLPALAALVFLAFVLVLAFMLVYRIWIRRKHR